MRENKESNFILIFSVKLGASFTKIRKKLPSCTFANFTAKLKILCVRMGRLSIFGYGDRSSMSTTKT